ncbi:hypothetical protein CDL12_22986 [Handroanthus impetiginosus]|uniref:AB hydrolase-1 domain-containing protein n=1 Tax=Handroanthus impetiginosus TaxID=429701 RepID=A0A2G9GHI5_9LAMI|nr:hypothetical protein CDL12_22986 [Handroanthus impetiginosus]
MDFMASLSNDDKVILVGHSYGGIPISFAMENYPTKISAAVFVTAYMPNCIDPPATLIQESFNRSSTSFMDCEFTFDQSPENRPISAMFGPDFMAAKLYQDCPQEDLELAKMLIRPNSFFMEELGKKSLLSQEKYGKIKRYYIVCEDDKVMDKGFQRYNIEKSPPEDEISIAGAAHMVMLSKPQELCTCLMGLAEKC